MARLRCVNHPFPGRILPANNVKRRRLTWSIPAETGGHPTPLLSKLKRRTSMVNTGRPSDDAPRSDEEQPFSSKPTSENEEQPLPIPPSELETPEERLARVQKKLAAGQYDSDDVLDRAAETMLRRIMDETE